MLEAGARGQRRRASKKQKKKRSKCKEMDALDLLSFSPSSSFLSASLSLFSRGRESYEHTPSQCVQQQRAEEAKAEAKQQQKCRLLFLFFFAAASSCLAPSGFAHSASLFSPRVLLFPLASGSEQRNGTEAPVRSDHREHRHARCREGEDAWKKTNALSCRLASVESGSSGAAARRFRQHPRPLGFLSPPLFLSLSSFLSSLSPISPETTGRQAEGLPRGQPCALQGRARGKKRETILFSSSSVVSFLSLAHHHHLNDQKNTEKTRQ